MKRQTGPQGGGGATAVPLREPTKPDDGRHVLAQLSEVLTAIDALQARAVSLVGRATDESASEQSCGVPLDLWLSVVGRMTRTDRRMLQSAGDCLAAMPNVTSAFQDGRLGWGQVRAIVLACRRLSADARGQVDSAVGEVIDEFVEAEPDEIVWRVDCLAADLDPKRQRQADKAAERGQFVALQPRLDGSGGTLFADLAAPGFATVSDAIAAGIDLTGIKPGKASIGSDGAAIPVRGRTRGQAAADALIDIAASYLGGGKDAKRPKPLLHLTMDFDTLLGLDDRHADILTTVTGGRLRVSADTARTLIGEAGAAVRTIVLEDTGRALGIGRKGRFAPAWMRDALDVLYPSCDGPNCRTAGRVSQADHVRGWEDFGRTDIDNMANVCTPDHGDKTRGWWDVTVRNDGTRIWRHTRTGFRIKTIPATRKLKAITPQHDPLPPPDQPLEPETATPTASN